MDARDVMTRRFSRVEYARLLDCGVLREGDPIELVGGQLVIKEPQDPRHATASQLVASALGAAFGSGWIVRTGFPLALDAESEPEPDVAVVAGGPRDFAAGHPAHPALVVEVSLSRLRFDRGAKASLYARAGVPEYWIVNIADRRLEVHRRPVADASADYGWRYALVSALADRDEAVPLAVPGARIPVADLLP